MTASKVWVHLRSLTASFFVGISIQIASGLGSYGPRLRISAGPSLPPSRIPMDRGQIEATEAGGGNSGLWLTVTVYTSSNVPRPGIWSGRNLTCRDPFWKQYAANSLKIKLVTYLSLRQTKTTYTFFYIHTYSNFRLLMLKFRPVELNIGHGNCCKLYHFTTTKVAIVTLMSDSSSSLSSNPVP